jgi:hypothetical protein
MLAKSLLHHLGIKGGNCGNLVLALESMYGKGQFPLVFDVIADEDWSFYGIAEAIWDPVDICISLPNRLYERLFEGDIEALHILLHEVGHCFLAHGIILHRESNLPPKKEEDAEVQADSFADSVMKVLIPKSRRYFKQLSLF